MCAESTADCLLISACCNGIFFIIGYTDDQRQQCLQHCPPSTLVSQLICVKSTRSGKYNLPAFAITNYQKIEKCLFFSVIFIVRRLLSLLLLPQFHTALTSYISCMSGELEARRESRAIKVKDSTAAPLIVYLGRHKDQAINK